MASKVFNRRAWSKQEDDMLVSIINEFSDQNQVDLNWKIISQRLSSKICSSTGFKRQSKQCRERWNNCLKPGLRQNQLWTLQQRQKLFNFYKAFGQKWCKIAEKIPGRSDNGVKNYFYSSVRKLLRKIDKYITIYNRKIKAQKYLLTKAKKNDNSSTVVLKSNTESEQNLKLLKPVTREAINKLLLLAEEKHIYKIEVTDDLQCKLIWKVRNQFIQLLQKNQIEEAQQISIKQLETGNDEQEDQNAIISQKQEQSDQVDSVQPKIETEKDENIEKNKIQLFNIQKLEQFITDLYSISAKTKKKKHRGYTLGTLSQKQIEQAIKAKKKQTLDSEKMIRRQLQEQHKDIIPSSKAVRAVGKTSNIDWDNFDSRNGLQESIKSKNSQVGSQTLKKHKKQQKRRAKDENKKNQINIKNQVKIESQFDGENFYQTPKNPENVFMGPKMNGLELFQQQSNRYYFPNSTIQVNSSSILSNSHNSMHLNSLNNQYPQTPAFGDQNFNFSTNMKNFGLPSQNLQYNTFQTFLNTVPIIKISKQERQEPSNSNRNSEKNSQHQQFQGNGLGLFQSFNSYQNPNSHSCQIFDNISSKNQRASNSLLRSLEFLPFRSSFLNTIPKVQELDFNQNQVRFFEGQFENEMIPSKKSQQQQFKPQQVSKDKKIKGNDSFLKTIPTIEKPKEVNPIQLPFNSGYFDINVNQNDRSVQLHHSSHLFAHSMIPTMSMFNPMNAFNSINRDRYNGLLTSLNEENMLMHSAEYSNNLPIRFINESSRLEEFHKNNNLAKSSSLQLINHQQLLYSSQYFGQSKPMQFQSNFNSSEKKSESIQKFNL